MIQVLIIEDDPMVAKFNGMYVNKVPGFALAGTAAGIEAGWELVKSGNIDLVLLDVYLANKNGLDVLVNARKANLAVDVIVVSSANDHASVQTALRYGAVDYLIKPFDFERFREALMRYKYRCIQMRQEGIRQEEVDALFHRRCGNKDWIGESLPKGITKETFLRVLREINKLEGWFSTADLAELTGISRVSLRKYLRFLEENNTLLSDVSYQGCGRPLQQYKLSAEGLDYLLSILLKEEKVRVE
ncbi:two-component system response regulator DcuR [Paenibacillus dendritiformis]|nr:response regulator [Paenibacillus dendritiformis]NRF96874.1 response regulator [Paenibacillus dendritiformis]GIO73610.1 two-component system response regulator DcuR [Paenibacillus dendritiformis]